MTAQQKSFKVLVIGDSCTDMYLMCRNTRLNPESSAPLVQISSIYSKDGMAGNVKYCLENLGLEVDLFTSKDVSIKRRYINSNTKEQLLRVDFDPKISPATNSDLKQVLNHQNYDAVVLADYNKGFLSIDNINYIRSIYSGPIFLDTKNKNLSNIGKGIYLKINEHEAKAADKVPDTAIVTWGASGVTWYREYWPALKSETVDVCGAGDAFMAGLVYGYLVDPDNFIEHAIVNGGLSVRHIGTYTPTLEEHNEGLDEYFKQCRKS